MLTWLFVGITTKTIRVGCMHTKFFLSNTITKCHLDTDLSITQVVTMIGETGVPVTFQKISTDQLSKFFQLV